MIDSEFRQGMSSRQKNKAKRMAKLVAKQRSRDLDPNEKRYRPEELFAVVGTRPVEWPNVSSGLR